MKFVIVTGGVVSSLGKGIAASSLGNLLVLRGYKISLVKLDPYINIDPGTMSPDQHGEVFVTSDGAETDLDLGHYERYTQLQLGRRHNHTAGQIYKKVIDQERAGRFLGKTVQIVPHITDAIKECILEGAGDDAQITIVEIGGTVGDIESLPFLEAVRQMNLELKRDDVVFIHIALLVALESSGEIKTKPIQHSVKQLNGYGIQPHVLICRGKENPDAGVRKKLAQFTNLNVNNIVFARDEPNLYRIPINLYEEKLDQIVLENLNLSLSDNDGQQMDKAIDNWNALIVRFDKRYEKSKDAIKIAIVGKYTNWSESYKSLQEALIHAAGHNDVDIDVDFMIGSVLEEEDHHDRLAKADAILVPGGFGKRCTEGMIMASRYARENNVPFLGICLGMQVAVIDFARHVIGLEDAGSTELDPDTPHPVIALVEQWYSKHADLDLVGTSHPTGGTMRLGSNPVHLVRGSLASKVYDSELINERHRHRYEFNMCYAEQFEALGMKVSGYSNESLAEIVELKDHDWFVGCQYHPEFESIVSKGHALFNAFIKAAITRHYKR